ncbi:MAG TPA: LysE family transporter [Solirubrobacteraceae bacterium]|jgi:L-lysine exporter family protein LysE/ArgO|nr:LysE family transporter [Solirubrobacteraceae bacterium]
MIDARALSALISGLLFGLSLIVAIGPQNAFVVRQGALRRHVAIVVAICAGSDIVLIAAGVSGAGAAFAGRPWLLGVTRVGGAAVLLAYAALAARRTLDPSAVQRSGEPGRTGRMAAIVACLVFTWLNPAVYLDTIVLLGSVAHTQSPRQWWFGAGAAAASLVWFIALAAAARLAHALLTRPRVWRAVDCFVAVVMTVTALRLLLA